MRWLPLAVSFLVALAVVPAAVRSLAERGLVRENYRGARIPFPGGIGIVAAALVALVPLALLQEVADVDVFGRSHFFVLFSSTGAPVSVTSSLVPVGLYVVGVAFLGLLDDLVGSGVLGEGEVSPPRGWRGHFGAIARGRFSTGALKAVGALGLALFVLAGRDLDTGEYLLAAALLVITTNLFNLLDLRPGRSLKGLAILGAALTLGSLDVDPLWTLGLFIGPMLVILPLDLREKAMLGDTGSNLVGAVAGFWLILTLDTTGQLIALGIALLLTIYGEFRSISSVVEKTPLLRQLDSLGRVRTNA
jgi:UDP-GlcNAc:undecaprenyl-phosphate/decaprenyl-phosphate GlcNAc-1-phosphate transferase